MICGFSVADPNALVIVAAGSAFESDKCLSAVGGFPRRGVRDVKPIRIVRRDSDAHSARAAAADAAVGVYQLPRFAGILGAVDAGIFSGLHGGVNDVRPAARNGDADAADVIIGCRKSFGERMPSISAIGGFEEAAAGSDKGFAAANFPWRHTRSPQRGVNCLRICRIEGEIGGTGVFVLIKNFLKSLAAVGGAEDAALGVWTIRMAFGGDENAVGIFRIDENRGDLLRVAETEMRPGFSRVGGFVNAIAGGKIGALQTFAAADVNDIGIGRCDGQRADGAGGLVVENRIPGVSKIGGLPDAAVDGSHVENVGLVRDAGDGHGAASAERADAAPAHFRIEFLIELQPDLLVGLLCVRRSAKNGGDEDSSDEPFSCGTDAHPSPP